MPGADSESLDAEAKLALLKRAYRALKLELERRDESQATERAAHQRERGLLLARTSELQRELQGLKEAVRSAGKEASARLQQLDRCKPQEATTTPAPDSVVSHCAQATTSTGATPAPPAAASYQRGMEWADRVLNARDVFKTALSTSIESVSALAAPLHVTTAVGCGMTAARRLPRLAHAAPTQTYRGGRRRCRRPLAAPRIPSRRLAIACHRCRRRCRTSSRTRRSFSRHRRRWAQQCNGIRLLRGRPGWLEAPPADAGAPVSSPGSQGGASSSARCGGCAAGLKSGIKLHVRYAAEASPVHAPTLFPALAARTGTLLSRPGRA